MAKKNFMNPSLNHKVNLTTPPLSKIRVHQAFAAFCFCLLSAIGELFHGPTAVAA